MIGELLRRDLAVGRADIGEAIGWTIKAKRGRMLTLFKMVSKLIEEASYLDLQLFK